MIVYLLVERADGVEPWVIDAIDEYVVDEWNGRFPDEFRKKLDDEPANRRVLKVRIAEGALDTAWNVPEVSGNVVPDA